MSKVALFNPATSAWLQTHPQLGVDLMEHLFSRLEIKYPRLWRQSFDGPRSVQTWKEVWAETFEREGITPADVKAGLDNVTRLYPDFPPTEGQFLRCCRPPVDYEAAFCEAANQLRLREDGLDKWSHPAIYWASVTIGAFDMRNASYPAIKGRWIAALDAALANRPYVEVPPPRVALPAPGKCSVPPEEAKRRIAELRAKLKGQIVVGEGRCEAAD